MLLFVFGVPVGEIVVYISKDIQSKNYVIKQPIK